MKKLHAFQNDALGFYDATDLSLMLHNKKVSPKELAQAAISRLQKVEPQLGAVAVDCFETALKRSEQPFYGPFGGIPSFVKDNEEVSGLPRQLGTLAFTAKPSKKNSPFVDQFISTGLNVMGKTTLPEFGLICSTENPKWYVTRNPWDTDYTPGGSSSGSAALVAAGVVPIAMANDGAGSTRIPASCCGLVGLKPSRNRLKNMDGSNMLPLNIVYEGVLTRSVRDTILFFQSAEKYFHYNKLERISQEVLPLQKRLKVVVFENVAKGKIGHQDEATVRTIEETARLMESLGHHVERHPFPVDIDELSNHYLTYYGFLAFFLQDLGRLLLKAKVNKSELENFTTGLVKHFKKNAFSLPSTLRLLKKVGADVENRFVDYDVILTPVVSHSVPKIGHFNPELPYEEISKRAVQFASYPGMQNITGSPAISLPMGTSDDGLPLGVQLVAAYGKDQLLLELALELEAAKPFLKIYE